MKLLLSSPQPVPAGRRYRASNFAEICQEMANLGSLGSSLQAPTEAACKAPEPPKVVVSRHSLEHPK